MPWCSPAAVPSVSSQRAVPSAGARRTAGASPVPGGLVPIVSAAAIFDLGRGGDFSARPDEEMGYAATAAAAAQPEGHDVERGNVGAGTGAVIGRGTYKGGVGTASITLENGRCGWRDSPWSTQLGMPFGSQGFGRCGGSRARHRSGSATPQHNARRRRHQRRPEQGGLQADRLCCPRRAGPGAESEPYPRRRRHGVRLATGAVELDRGTGTRPAVQPHRAAERGGRRRDRWPSWTASPGPEAVRTPAGEFAAYGPVVRYHGPI